MVPSGDGAREPSSEVVSLFAFVDDFHQALENIRPPLSADQLEQIDDLVFYKLLRMRVDSLKLTLDKSSLRHACVQLLARLTSQSSAARTISLVRTLCILNAGARLPIGQFAVSVWRVVAQPAEEKCDGLGGIVMKACVDSLSRSHAAEWVGAEGMKVLMDYVIAVLQGNGIPPPVSPEGEVEVIKRAKEDTPHRSRCGLRLAIDAASYTLDIFNLEGPREAGEFEGLEAWRMKLHRQIVRLLRVCRTEMVRQHLVMTIMRPVYHGWRHIGALEEIWSSIANADQESVHLHLAVLCILDEDLTHFLALPARHAREFWDLLYLGMSHESDLCRRRALHILQQVLTWADGISQGRIDASSAEFPQQAKDPFSREASSDWKDYVRISEVLEMETEMHLFDQVIPTLERLCGKLRPANSYVGGPAFCTEFRWIAIPLGMLISTGSVPRRRSLIYRLVNGDLGLGKSVEKDASRETVIHSQSLSHMDETWAAQVLLPALDHVGWHSSTTRESLRNFSQSVTTFFRCYVQTMPVARVKNFLTLLMEAIRKRSIGTTGTLHAVLSAFGDTGTKVPAMGRDLLLQLKETLLVILPPLNQAKRELLLDGVMGILGAFTDFEELSLLWSVPDPQTDGGGYRNTKGCGLCESDRLPPVFSLVTSIFSAIPADLAMTRYMSHLADWVSNMPLKVNGASDMQYGEKHVLWLDMFKDCVKTCLTRTDIDTTESTGDADAEGRNLCLLGMVLSQGFAFQENRQQILAAGLSPLVSALERCWHEPYVPAETVRMALILYKNWTEVSIMEGDAGIWRMMPLDACVDEIITLVTARLGVLIEAASHTPVSNFVDGNVAGGDDVEVLLTVLSASTGGMGSLSAVRTRVFHPGVIDLRDKCVSLLIRVGETSLPPAAHLLAIASLERVVRAQGRRCGQGDVCTETAVLEYHGVQCIEESLTVATAEGLVLSLVERTVQGRIVSGNGSISQEPGSAWMKILKDHELRKWSCVAMLLPFVLDGKRGEDGRIGQTLASPVCEALVDGIRMSLREELPKAMACFRTVFPHYISSLPREEQAAGFSRVFELVWEAFTEVRRPQHSLVRDFLSGVLHPVHLAMPVLNGVALSADEVQELCLPRAFDAFLRFGAANRPNVLRALVAQLIALWKQDPGSILNLVPGVTELLLIKEWGGGIETISNDEGSSAAEAPRLMLLLFIERWVIPTAVAGNQELMQVLRALTFALMALQESKEFRQCNVTDPVVYGRKLRGWQALCVLCRYFCGSHASADDQATEIVRAIATWFWPVHGRTSLPPVRHHMEVFAVRLCKAYPHLFLDPVVKELKDFRLPGQVLCSLLIVAGQCVVGYQPISSSHHRLNLFEACLPWMVGTHVMGRMIAQLVCFSLLPEAAADAERTHLQDLFSFLRDNPDMVKMRKRQLESFRQADCLAMCTVEGMLKAHSVGSNGDITPVHMCELLQEAMDDIWKEALEKNRALTEGRAWLQTAAEVKKGTWFEEDAPEAIQDVDGHIQQKILPWDKLELAVGLAGITSLDQSTATGKLRQSVVMCATLVDKMPNLAGLARTCEIFAASRLVVPDARILKNPGFSKISRGAEEWLPIEELAEGQLLAWLRGVKRRGYTLVGVEQTNNSVCLTKMKFPPRCVLLLGGEQRGLPLEMINEMDFCCQIPQQGVLRSLNAHVSGALILWEYTRQMLTSATP